MDCRHRHTRHIAPVLLVLALMVPMHTRAMPPITAQGVIWHDTNCDGIRLADEPGRHGQTVYLFAAGDDGISNTPDDQNIDLWTTGTSNAYRFALGSTGLDYSIVILARDQPPGMVPAPLRAGADRMRDNDLRGDLWATDAFRFHETATVTGIDIGLCTLVQPHHLYLPFTRR